MKSVSLQSRCPTQNLLQACLLNSAKTCNNKQNDNRAIMTIQTDNDINRLLSNEIYIVHPIMMICQFHASRLSNSSSLVRYHMHHRSLVAFTSRGFCHTRCHNYNNETLNKNDERLTRWLVDGRQLDMATSHFNCKCGERTVAAAAKNEALNDV